jgi:glycosyltransferase involved in cell wall biosynthesis
MKIVFVLPGRARSGGVRCTSIMASWLHERGHDVRILYQKEMGFRDRGRHIRDRLFYSSGPNWLYQFKGSVDAFSELSKCRFEKEEIIVGVGMAMCAALASLGSLPNRKVQYIHGATPWLPELRAKALSLPLPKIVVASYLKDLVENIGRGEVLATIHNGIDTDEYFSCVPDSERDGVGLVYSSDPPKDPATTLGALEELSKLRPDVPIRVFGTEKRPRQLKCQSYSRYPSLEKARQIYSRSLVWIVASSSEGFPAPVLEAMACGCCVVATDCGGTRDSIIDGENGFLVPVGDIKEIARRVEMLLDDSRLRTRMRSKAEETARRFSWRRCIDQLESVIATVSQDGIVGLPDKCAF